MQVFRIAYKDYAKALIPSKANGRWAAAGKAVIYTAGSIALAMLENLVRRQGLGFNDDYRIMVIEIPNSLEMLTIKTSSLEEGWNDVLDYSKCQPAGHRWYDEARYPVMKVPSAIVPLEYNYVLNVNHADFSKVKLIDVAGFIPDPRIEAMLKGTEKG
ncbi:RES family NAD+ phosphorylase [Chitinophaga japonensis]|uniref:RES domain-containing protein n=1 Tax=Chitinophaga japonensis TaxID=104662 RepID=A0A562T038_CHIJA|nr:RES family NAD+ phosphorylase [Chitinophaga japonensis]TWI86897.1 RES domain-containing protein [Chitinophaga japonensis]